MSSNSQDMEVCVCAWLIMLVVGEIVPNIQILGSLTLIKFVSVMYVTLCGIKSYKYIKYNMKLQKFGAKSAIADSCFGLIGPRQCSAALGGPATSTEDLRHQGALNKPGVLKYLWVS